MDRNRGGGISRSFGPRIAAAVLVLLGLLTGLVWVAEAGAQPVPTGTPVALIELRVHSCPDDFEGTGFFQHQTQCTSERSLYGVGIGVESGRDEPAFQYSQPDDTGRAALMRWLVTPGEVTITEVAPDSIKPSVAFCSLQPIRPVPLTMDGEEVPLDDGVMTIALDEGDTLMCDWYRFPGGVTAGDPGNGDDGGGGDNQRSDTDSDGLFDDDEADVYGTDSDVADTDGDGVSDGAEIYFETDPLVANEPTTRADSDEDGLYDDDEEDVYNTDPTTFDTDGDGVGDGEEVFLGTDPTVADGNPGGGNGGNNGGNNGGGGNGGNNGDAVDANCLDREEAIFLTMLNELRAETGAPPVRVSGTLTKAAEGHSRDMGVRNFTAHTNPDGTTDQQRILAAGYVPGNPYRLAENLYWGNEAGRAAFEWWEASPGHRPNMVNPELVAIGIARVEVPGSTHGWYWTTTHANQFDVAPDC